MLWRVDKGDSYVVGVGVMSVGAIAPGPLSGARERSDTGALFQIFF